MPSLAWAAAATAAVVLIGTAGTQAKWTDQATIPGGTLQAGFVDLTVDGVDDLSSTVLDVSDLLPGGSVAHVFTVRNAGDVPLHYTASTDGSGGLFGALVTSVTGADSTDGTSCAGPALATPRTLQPGDAEKVCVELALPAGASAALAGTSADVDVTFAGSVAGGAWSDDAAVTGTHLGALDIPDVGPALTCGSGLLGALTMTWAPVAHATDYLVEGPGVDDRVPAGSSLSETLTGIGTYTVTAVFGSDSWRSPSSSLSLTSGITGLLCPLGSH